MTANFDSDRQIGSFEESSLRSILERAAKMDAAFVGVTIRSPVVCPENLFISRPEEPAALWASMPGKIDVGMGVLDEITSHDLLKPPDIVKRTELIRQNFQCVGFGAAAVTPEYFGGFAFAPSNKPSTVWRDFEPYAFAVPRYLYRTDNDRASLTLFARQAELRREDFRLQVLNRLSTLVRFKDHAATSQTIPFMKLLHRMENPNRDVWNSKVSAACQLLANRVLEKVVLARELCLEFDRDPSVAMILRNFMSRRDGSICFALRRGTSTFLGATPERLVSRRGSSICSEALAGSAAVGDTCSIDALVNGAKDRLEHKLVVRDIISRMSAIGADISVPDAPEVLQFGPVVHLRTLLRGRKLDAPHVLTLAQLLHPTPAVGGVPVERALEFINEHESFDRGRYASPIGRFDCNSDGELVVGLRSGLVRGRQVRLFAGAGLVVGSDAAAEWRETELKFGSFLEALGLGPDSNVISILQGETS